MIDVNDYLRKLDIEEDSDIKDNEAYQKRLFEECVFQNNNRIEKRKELFARYQKGEPLLGEKGIRKELAAFDLAYFGRAYLPHYFKRKSPQFHRELDEIWTEGILKNENPFYAAKKIERMNGSRHAVAAPRGHAKSTNLTFKDTIHAVLYQYKHYILILSDSSDQAEGFLEDIKTELEENGNILMDFGVQKGKTWKSGQIITKSDIQMDAIGSGKKVRGRKHRNWRPDLIVLDDIENDENVNTVEQRRKLKNWFTKAVEKAGDTYTDIIYIGTILHYDSLLNNILTQNPRYQRKKYQAVIQEAENTALWEEWEQIYTNLFNDTHEQDARSFYEANEEEMLKGTKVLWEAKWSYYDLMVMKVSEGVASFNSELQNEPIDPENAAFNEEWFDYYEPDEMDFSSDEFVLIGANDPSLGKNKKSDTSSIINLALSLNTGYMYVVEASVEKRKPDVIIDDVIEMSKRNKRDLKKGFYKFGVETVQFQYFFKEIMVDRARETGEYIPIEEIQSTVNKDVRILSLQPLIKNKYIKFNRNHKALLEQLKEYPMGKNDDAPDGLQMAVNLAMQVRNIAEKVNYKTVLRRKLSFRKGAY